MIEASAQPLIQIWTEGKVLSGQDETIIAVETLFTASLPSAFKVETQEAQLMGPPGPAGGEALTTDPLAYYLLARD